MKKLLPLLAIAMLMSAPAFAFADINNTYNTTNVSQTIEQNDFAGGLGADFVVYESPSPWAENVKVEYKYDIENDANSVYGVVTVNIWDALAKSE